MTVTRDYRFSNERLLVNEWHSLASDKWPQQTLIEVVQRILTERVTQSLPLSWQGSYPPARANQWISERDNDGVTLLAVDKIEKHPIGMGILFESDDNGKLRLG